MIIIVVSDRLGIAIVSLFVSILVSIVICN